MNKKTTDKKTPKLVTEEQLKTELGYLERVLKVEIKLSGLATAQRVGEKMTQVKNQLLTVIDPLLRELEERREDREVGTYQTSRLKEQVDDHEKRLAKLETA